jgi:Ser/Thr protein kinase RdoA (MazF antagonist)
MLPHADEVARTFGLGTVRSATPVPGGLSNDLWRVDTDTGRYAVKVMRTNADAPDFRPNVEAAYAVERAAFGAGVPCPEPVSVDGRCLATVGPELVRVHRWVDGRPVSPPDWLEQAGALAARIHAVADHVEAPLDDRPRGADGWADLAGHPDVPTALAARLHRHASDLAELEEGTAASGLHVTHAGTHGDLDPKNTLALGTTLLALDWDAAGPRSIVREAVTVGLDWSTDVAGFARVLTAYAAAGASVPADPWVFGGWVAATGGWLVHNATTRIGTPFGVAETTLALDRLLHLRASLPELVSVLADTA